MALRITFQRPPTKTPPWAHSITGVLSRYVGIVAIVAFAIAFHKPMLAENPVEKAASKPFAAPKLSADAYHAHTWIDTLPTPNLTNYHLLHGPARAISLLRQRGWECSAQLGPWTDESLRDIDVVYINLVSADRPPFRQEEIESLDRFVKNGGGLFLVVDHTNCYYHNHVLGNLADRFDIDLHSETLCDRAPHTIGSGNGWVVLSDIRPHPVTAEVQRFVMMTGGIVDSRMGLVYSSPESWGDAAMIPPYGESNGPGFYGDFQRQPLEPTGPHAAVGAKEWGQGRIVVVADQNAFGAFALNYLDNRRLWLSAMGWLANREGNEELAPDSDTVLQGQSLVWCRESRDNGALRFADGGDRGLYHLFAWLNKFSDARGTERNIKDAKVLFIPDEQAIRNREDANEIVQFMEQPGRTVVILSASQSSAEQIAALPWANWKKSGLSGPYPALGPFLAWEHPSGSKLIWLQSECCLNSNFPAPEIPVPPKSQSLIEAWKQFLTECGVTFPSEESRSASWLDDLDR
ncbi:hypothetical protein SH501x_000073 [Pirellulaceae bacterium SH501]